MKAARWIFLFLIFGLAAALPAAAEDARQEVKSPDGKVILTFNLTGEGSPVYTVSYQGKPVIIESQMGLALKDGPGFLNGLKVTGVQPVSHDETWKPVAAERSSIRDHYNGLTVNLEGAQGRKLQLAIRAYDEGAGFRYTLPEQADLKDFTITKEVTEFRFDGNYPCWPVYYAQGEYKGGLKLSDVKKDCERPLTVEIPGGPCVAVGEAGMLDYFRMRLQPSDRPNGVKVFPDGVVTGTAPFSSPWRFVMIGDTPGQLLERNYLVLNFNDPSAIKDTSWIKPGKVFRSMPLSTEGCKPFIDFTAKMGMQYILFDAGWYGSWREPDSDASHSYNEKPGFEYWLPPSQRHPPTGPPLDVKAVVEYAKQKGIGVILYVDRGELEKQGSKLYPLYHQWGVKGIKYGFVQVGPQKWAKWITDQVRLCAENELMVDIHDEYRVTGTSRTWPNLMTVEGVNGDESAPPASDCTARPFTRGLCGPFDNTVCMFSPNLYAAPGPQMGRRGDVRKSRAFQLAKAIMVFSPLQHLFWYDAPEAYHGEPELELWKTLPVIWDETKVVNGVIGQYITEARRSGQEWYVGSLNANQRRALDIPLTFLEPGKQYTAEIYNEGVPGSREEADLKKVSIEKKAVDASTVIKADMSDIGGHAMRIVPVN